MMALFRYAVAALLLVWTGAGHAADRDAYAQAAELHQRGDNAAALALLERHLQEQPRDSRARFLKAVILAGQSRTQEAIDVLTALSEEFPELPEPHNNLAVLYAGQGRYDDARRELEMAVRAYPGFALAYQNLGDIYATLAAKAYQDALRADPKNTAARTKLEHLRELLPPGTVTTAASPAAPAAPVTAARPAPPPVARAGAAESPTRPAPTAAPAGAAATSPPTAPSTPSAGAAATASPAASPGSPAVAAETAALATPAPLPTGTPLPPPASPVADAKPAPARVVVAPTVLRTVQEWASAWSEKDADRYLSFYANDFRTPKGEPRASWEAARRTQLGAPRIIQVEILGPRVTFSGPDRATVSFKQNYRADDYRSSGRKTLELVRRGDQWLIQQETIVFR